MAWSAGFIDRLKNHNRDEPLSKRLKLAENVFYSPEIPIIRKEDCIFGWLCSELSNDNYTMVWKTIYNCLSINPINFSKVSPESKNLLIEKLIECLNEYPNRQISEEMVKSSTYIFSSTNYQSDLTKNKVFSLIKAFLAFTIKVITVDQLDNDSQFHDSSVAIECVERAIDIFQICKQNFSCIKDLNAVFIEEVLFPLSSLLEILKLKKIPSKLILESQKCIKKLMLDDIKSITSASDEKNFKLKENEFFFNTLKNKITTSKFEDIKSAFIFLFECTVHNFRQNPAIVDFILRKLWNCIEHKEQSKIILASLLENSLDVSYNFDNEIDGVTFKTFLEIQIEEIKSKKKCFKTSDYQLLSAISKLNPLIIEDSIQSLFERILFEKKSKESVIISYENLITELWKATVRLRRQHKFVSKFLLAISSYAKKEKFQFKNNKLKLPENFIIEFSKDLQSRTTGAQILAILNTFIFHLKTDYINKIKTTDSMTQVCLSIKILANFLVIFFENCNLLDNSLTNDWQVKFYQSFTDLQNTLIVFSEILYENTIQHETIIFVAFSSMVKIWCETYDVLRYYIPNIACKELSFPINEIQLKKFKQMVKECKHQDCEYSLNQLMLFNSVIYDRNNKQPIKEKIITHLWSVIIKNYFEIIESFTEKQILKLTSHLVKEATCTQDNLEKWTLVLKENISKVTKTFTTAAALQSISNIIENIEICSTKMIINTIDFETILKSINDQKSCKKALKPATKEIAKQNFKPLNAIDFDKVRLNLIFISNLPLSYLDPQIRKFLFTILYVFDEETKNIRDLKKFITNLYSDFLSQNDIDILNSVSKPKILIDHFKNDTKILFKLFKLSLTKVSVLSFWEKFINEEECSRKISSILLICLEKSKNKVVFSNSKSILHDLTLKLSNKLTENLDVEINNSYEIAGLRVIVKIILLEKQELKDNLKSFVELTMKNITKNTEERNDELINEILQLSLIVLEHRKIFNITDNVLQNLCTIFINNPNKKIFFHFLEILKDNEFQFFIHSISNKTKESLINGNVQVLEKLMLIWESFSKAEAKMTRTKVMKSSINHFFKDLLVLEIKDFSSTFLLKIYRTFVTSKRMVQLSNIVVDSIFVTSMDCLNNLSKEAKLIACQEALGLCSDFVRSKVDFILDRLPILTNLFRKVVGIVLQESKNVDENNEQMFKILAVDIEKFCTFFAKLKKDVVRITPHLIADLIAMSRAKVLPQFLKVSIDSSLSNLLSNCDRHAISFLFRTLPVSDQQVFKTAYNNYVKYNKFTGKI